LEGDNSIAQVAKELGLSYNPLHSWVKEYKESNRTSFVGSGNIKPENQEIIELCRRNQELEKELAILKNVRHLHQKLEAIYAFIFQHRNEFLVVKMCQVLGVSRSGYYDCLKRPKGKQKERKEQWTQQI
jgi:transposase